MKVQPIETVQGRNRAQMRKNKQNGFVYRQSVQAVGQRSPTGTYAAGRDWSAWLEARGNVI